MEQNLIDEAIYNKYIAPTKGKRQECFGIEIELPIVNLKKKAVDEAVVFEMSKAFREKFGFNAVGHDTNGNVNSMLDPITGDDLSFDCCFSNLELSLGKGIDLREIKKRFDAYYTFINNCLKKYDHTLTGMGINPYYELNHNQPIQNERYRMLYHHLHSYKKYVDEGFPFHKYPTFGTFTSASQVQIDVEYNSLIDTINTFGRLEPFKAVLFANSLLPDEQEYLCTRNMLWERSMQGYNPHNIGMFECELADVDELLEYIKTTSIYCTMRNGKYVNFRPIPINEYLNTESVNGEYFDGERYRRITIRPCIDDLEHLRSFKFEDLTFRGTIEFRSACTQPVRDSMCVAAFHMGLMARLEELKELLSSDNVIYHHGYTATELQRMLSKKTLPLFVNREALSDKLCEIIELAAAGLNERGKDEAVFLTPLYKRAENLLSPAGIIDKGLKNGRTIEYYIREYSII